MTQTQTFYTTDSENIDPAFLSMPAEHLEECTQLEGLRYFGEFMAKKFPQYNFLVTNVQPHDKTWIGAICRHEGALLSPTENVLNDLKRMESLFKCFHGERTRK